MRHSWAKEKVPPGQVVVLFAVRRFPAPFPFLRRALGLAAGLGLGGASPLHAGWDEVSDYLGSEMTFVSEERDRSLQISGRLDVATYYVPEPAPDLLYTAPDTKLLFSPVLRIFADGRLAEGVQARAQLRADRGFDPADEAVELRVEEWLLRFALAPKHRAGLRVGRFATVFGSWARRHLAWDYPFVTAPLAQESLTGLWDLRTVPSAAILERWARVSPLGTPSTLVFDELNSIPVMWGPVYGTGAAVSAGGARWDFAAELKNVGLSSRPDTWGELGEDVWRTPAYATRLGWRPGAPWDLGVSFERSIYLRPVPTALAAGYSRSDYTQTSVGHDVAYAWRHFQFWGEIIASRFEVPPLGEADSLSYALEAKYRFTPRWAGFARWSQQFFAPIDLPGGDEVRWGRDAWRIEAGAAMRFAAHAQIKFQAGLLHERPALDSLIPSAAAQLSLRF